MKRPAIFLDRDGTLIEEVNYLHRVEDLRLFPFTKRSVDALKDAGFRLIVVTNQSGIGRGIYTAAQMHAVHAAIQEQLGGAIDAFYFCPHLPCDGCKCRKPRNGMIEAAKADLEIDIERSWMIGDKGIDVETGVIAGTRTGFVLTGYGEQHLSSLRHIPTIVAPDLGGVAEQILLQPSRP